MQSRLLVFASALVFSTTGASCPRSDDPPAMAASPAPLVVTVAAPPVDPAPIVVAPEAPASAAPASATLVSVAPASAPLIDPATLTTLPPELVDDGSDDVPDPDP